MSSTSLKLAGALTTIYREGEGGETGPLTRI
jgi:hypothetical protein